MSRYVCHFLVNLSPGHVRSSLKQLFEACKMDAIYETNDYLMAREIPGRVTFTKLVSAEVLIDVTAATQSSVQLSFVVKNEELPLNPHNHCREIFDLLRMTIAQNYDWEAIDNIRWPTGAVRVASACASGRLTPKAERSQSSLSTGDSISIPATASSLSEKPKIAIVGCVSDSVTHQITTANLFGQKSYFQGQAAMATENLAATAATISPESDPTPSRSIGAKSHPHSHHLHHSNELEHYLQSPTP